MRLFHVSDPKEQSGVPEDDPQILVECFDCLQTHRNVEDVHA